MMICAIDEGFDACVPCLNWSENNPRIAWAQFPVFSATMYEELNPYYFEQEKPDLKEIKSYN